MLKQERERWRRELGGGEVKHNQEITGNDRVGVRGGRRHAHVEFSPQHAWIGEAEIQNSDQEVVSGKHVAERRACQHSEQVAAEWTKS